MNDTGFVVSDTSWLRAGWLYFLTVFGAGFVLGVIRVLLLIPRMGVRTAELIELPFMVLVTIVAARWVVLRFTISAVRHAPLRVGLFALSLLIAAEIGLGSLRGATPSEYLTGRDPVSGPAYFAALALFGLMPVLIVRKVERIAAANGLIDAFIPRADAAESHEILIQAPAEVVFGVALNFDLLSIPLVRAIFRLRELVFGIKPKPRIRAKGFVAETMELGWQVLAYDSGRELVMGAVTQPWVGDVKFRGVPPEKFSSFAEPLFVKIVWTLEAEPVDAHTTRFRTQTRVLATDEDARRKFLRYWAFAGLFIVLIRRLANRAIRRVAERSIHGTGGVLPLRHGPR